MPAPPLTWKKNLTTGVVAAVANGRRYEIREGYGGRFVLTVPSRTVPYTASGSKELCKAVAAWDAAGTRPEDRPVFFARGTDETVVQWLTRLARDEGMNPRQVMRSARMRADGGVEPDALPAAVVAQLVRDTFALACRWVKDHNERVGRGEALGFVEIKHADWLGLGLVRRPSPDETADAGDLGTVPKPPPPKAEAARPPARPGPAGKDRFGCRLGTGAAAINAVLSVTPQTTQQIQSQVTARTVSGHLSRLADDGIIIRDPDGRWRLPAD